MHIGLIILQFKLYFGYFDLVKPSLTKSTQVPQQTWLQWFEIGYLSPICIQYTISILSLMIIGHDQHYYGLLLLWPYFIIWTWFWASKSISRWILGVFIVIISGFDIFDSIGIFKSWFWEKKMMMLAVLFPNNDYWCFAFKRMQKS